MSELLLHPANFPDLVIGANVISRMRAARRPLTALKIYLTERVDENPYDAGAIWDLSQVLLTEGKRRDGLRLQAEAIALRRTFRIVHGDGSGPVVLALVVPGDGGANLPVDLLLHGSDCTLWLCYIVPDAPDVTDLPAHDLIVVALTMPEDNATIRHRLADMLDHMAAPVMSDTVLEESGLEAFGNCLDANGVPSPAACGRFVSAMISLVTAIRPRRPDVPWSCG